MRSPLILHFARWNRSSSLSGFSYVLFSISDQIVPFYFCKELIQESFINLPLKWSENIKTRKATEICFLSRMPWNILCMLYESSKSYKMFSSTVVMPPDIFAFQRHNAGYTSEVRHLFLDTWGKVIYAYCRMYLLPVHWYMIFPNRGRSL